MDENMTLEQANALLDQKIKQLQDKALPLQDSLKIYSEACELLAFCMDKLNTYKGTIQTYNEKLASLNAEEN